MREGFLTLGGNLRLTGDAIRNVRAECETGQGGPLRELLEECVPRVYRFALRLTGDQHLAEDLTQETMLRAWQRMGQLRDPKAARAWLFQITANLWRDQLRRGRSNVARAVPLEGADALKLSSSDANAEDEMDWVMRVMSSLPPRQQQVLHLSACEGLSLMEIASLLEISIDAAKASLSVAKKRMRAALHEQQAMSPK